MLSCLRICCRQHLGLVVIPSHTMFIACWCYVLQAEPSDSAKESGQEVAWQQELLCPGDHQDPISVLIGWSSRFLKVTVRSM